MMRGRPTQPVGRHVRRPRVVVVVRHTAIPRFAAFPSNSDGDATTVRVRFSKRI